MQDAVKTTYTLKGGPKGLPVMGVLLDVLRHPLGLLEDNALYYGDIIPFSVMGQKFLQLNHPDLIRYVLMENHKNYRKSDVYLRFESVIGLGLLTSNGEKWRRDRQKIQPMFKREQIEGYYFNIVNDVGEKYKRRWLALTENGKAELNITSEMASITTEVILKVIFGKDNLDEKTIVLLHNSYSLFMDYLKNVRMLPKVDLRKVFHTPTYARFKKELDYVDGIFERLSARYKKGESSDKYNMLALLIEAQKEDPEHFNAHSIRDHSVSMVFAGFETTSILMQWLWYALDSRPDIVEKARREIISFASCTAGIDSSGLTYEAVNKMDYLSAVSKETMRLYPPLWATSRQPVEGDCLGELKVTPRDIIILPQIVMHRHPRWWDEPNAFIPERFMPENENNIDVGLYFPFSQGPRKCSGFKFAEMEAKVIMAKLLPLFKVTVLNTLDNRFDPGVSLKLKQALLVEIDRI